MIQVLTPDQQTIDELFKHGAYIYKRRYSVEPSRTSPSIPLRCERCQTYNDHFTRNFPNQLKFGYSTEQHNTKECTSIQQPSKCSQCGEPHPTFSYKCKNRPQPNSETPGFTVPLRIPEPTQQPATHSVLSPVTVEQLLTFQNYFTIDTFEMRALPDLQRSLHKKLPESAKIWSSVDLFLLNPHWWSPII